MITVIILWQRYTSYEATERQTPVPLVASEVAAKQLSDLSWPNFCQRLASCAWGCGGTRLTTSEKDGGG